MAANVSVPGKEAYPLAQATVHCKRRIYAPVTPRSGRTEAGAPLAAAPGVEEESGETGAPHRDLGSYAAQPLGDRSPPQGPGARPLAIHAAAKARAAATRWAVEEQPHVPGATGQHDAATDKPAPARAGAESIPAYRAELAEGLRAQAQPDDFVFEVAGQMAVH